MSGLWINNNGGRPNCPHCGAHINWNQDTEENHIPEKKNPQPITKADEKILTDVLNEACTDTTQKLQLKALIKGFFLTPRTAHAFFKVSRKRHRMYDLDLDNMRFNSEYSEYDD